MLSTKIVVPVICITVALTGSRGDASTSAPCQAEEAAKASESAMFEASVRAGVTVPELRTVLGALEQQVTTLSSLVGTAIDQRPQRAPSKGDVNWYVDSDELRRLYEAGELPMVVSSAIDSGSFAQWFPQQVVAWRFDNAWLTCEAARISGIWNLSVVVRGVAGIQMVTSAPMSEPERGGSWTGYTAGGNWMCLWRSIPDEIDPPTIYACVCDAKSDSCGLLPSIAGHEGLTPVVPGKPGSSVVRDEDAVTIPLK